MKRTKQPDDIKNNENKIISIGINGLGSNCYVVSRKTKPKYISTLDISFDIATDDRWITSHSEYKNFIFIMDRI